MNTQPHDSAVRGACHCSRGSRRRTVQNNAGWILPGLMLVLLPKCPLCLAATLSVLFGIGLSTEAATVVHGTVMVLCIVTIVIFVARQASNFFNPPARASSMNKSR